MASTARPLGALSMARGCARIDAGPDTAKIGSADRVQDHARLLAVIGVRKTFPHGLDPSRTSGQPARQSKRDRGALTPGGCSLLAFGGHGFPAADQQAE